MAFPTQLSFRPDKDFHSVYFSCQKHTLSLWSIDVSTDGLLVAVQVTRFHEFQLILNGKWLNLHVSLKTTKQPS